MPLLYVHVPFCLKKCAYCAFYSEPILVRTEASTGQDPGLRFVATPIGYYLAGLKNEIRLRQEELRSLAPEQTKNQNFSSLFIGGGTPTALAAEEICELLQSLRQGYDLGDPEDTGIERTCEANPGTLTLEKLQVLRRQGINRISLGVQSFNDSLLSAIGRAHRVEDSVKSVGLIRQAGIANLNLDLMFGLPGQNLEDWRQTLVAALRLQPDHLSVYGLMIEENTPLAQDRKSLELLPDDDQQADMYDLAREILGEWGYRHYETSNFALNGAECRHNLGYWRGDEYLGLGPGAVSYLDHRRWKNQEDLTTYGNRLEVGVLPVDPEEDEPVTLRERIAERIILSLRLEEGLNLAAFAEEFGQSLMDIYPALLERYQKLDILRVEEGNLKLNRRFWFVANGVLQDFAG